MIGFGHGSVLRLGTKTKIQEACATKATKEEDEEEDEAGFRDDGVSKADSGARTGV